MSETITAASPLARVRWRFAMAWGLVALVAFVFFLQWTFPYDAVKDRLVEALSAKYNVSVGAVQRGVLPGRMTLRKVSLEARPTKLGEVPRVIFIENIDLRVGLFSALTGNLALGFDVALGGGALEGTVSLGKSAIDLSLTGRGVSMASVPGLAEAVGLPVGGKLNTDVALHLPLLAASKRAVDIPKITGQVKLSCKVGCTVGDGVARVKPSARDNSKNAIFGADGIVVPQLSIAQFTMALEFKQGHATLGTFDLVSPDGDADIQLDIALAKVFQDSEVKGCIKFKLSPELKSREEKFGNIQAFIGTPIDKEGYNNIELFRTLRNMGRRPAEACSEASVQGSSASGNVEARPSGMRPSPRPDLPAMPVDAAPPVPVPQVPPEAPVAPYQAPDAATAGGTASEPTSIRQDSGTMTTEEAEATRKRVMEAAERVEAPPPPVINGEAPPADYVQ